MALLIVDFGAQPQDGSLLLYILEEEFRLVPLRLYPAGIFKSSPARILALSDDEEGIEIKGFIIHIVMMSELVSLMMYRFDRGNKSPCC